MRRIIIMIFVLACLLFPLTAGAANIPSAAKSLGQQLDEQLMGRFETAANGSLDSRTERITRNNITIIGTTPANINNLNQANPLARQMMEEVSRWLVDRGYRYDEIRKGKYIRFDRKVGEFILTRDVAQLANRNGQGQVILAGTYVISGAAVRFTMSLICVDTGMTLAKANATVPITPDLQPMLVENYAPGSGLIPSTYTRLQ